MANKRSKPTAADIAAAARLKKIWNAKARALGLTQERMAGLMDMTQGAISQYVNGVIPLNYRAVMEFSRALECEPEEIRADLPEQAITRSVRSIPGAGESTGHVRSESIEARIKAEQDSDARSMVIRSLIYALVKNIPAAGPVFAKHLKDQADSHRPLPFSTRHGILWEALNIVGQDRHQKAGSPLARTPGGFAKKSS